MIFADEDKLLFYLAQLKLGVPLAEATNIHIFHIVKSVAFLRIHSFHSNL